MDAMPGLMESLLGLAPGVSGGFGGLESFGLNYVNGLLPPWMYYVWGFMCSVPLFKTEANRDARTAYLEPDQLALTQGGAQNFVQSVRMLAEVKPDFPVLNLDMENAHNTVSRRLVIKERTSLL